ncbi:MAG: HAD hydrolase-like protein, partial [Eubacteriales bacterium]|nr:HAD hydrolase-like protein [Eubacteriales bacterium]
MPYKYILFDLDGTLTDSAEGIINSMIYALDKFNLAIPLKEVIFSRVGPPLDETFRFFGVPAEKVTEAINVYREYFAAKGIFENRVYEGIPEQLEKLRKRRITLLVATSKPQLFARRITDKFGLSHYFDFVAGSNMNETRTAKAEVISYALE